MGRGALSRYEWVVFDADGTLFDFNHAQASALERTAIEFGFGFSSEILDAYKTISESLWREFEAGRINVEHVRVARFELLLGQLGVSENPSEVCRTYLRHLGTEARLLPDAALVVRTLRRHASLVLATNGFADVQRRRLAASSIADCFRGVVISDEVGHGKPHAAFFREVFRAMGDPPKRQALVVGDSLTSDILGGNDFGTHTCWFNPGRAPAGHMAPTYTITELAEVLGIVVPARHA